MKNFVWAIVAVALLTGSAMAQSGVGIWRVNACSEIKAPVVGSSFCFERATNLLKRWNSTDWETMTGTGTGGSTNASDLTSGTLPDGRFPATLPALSGVNLTALNASNLASGTIPAGRFPASLTLSANLAAANLTSTGQTLFMNAAQTVFIKAGTGSPEGVVTAGVGSIWIRTDGGTNTSIYRKEGTGNTGWVAESAAGGGPFSSGNLAPLFSTSVANPTTAPALSFSLSSQSANVVFAGPVSGGAAPPTFRNLVAADISSLDPTLAALAAFNSNGLLTQTAADTFVARTIIGVANETLVTNGNGVAGNPQIGLAAALDLSAKASTAPVKAGLASATPSSCLASKDLFIKTDATPGQQLFICNTAGNGYVLVGDGTGAAGTVTGTGTANKLARWLSPTSLGPTTQIAEISDVLHVGNTDVQSLTFSYVNAPLGLNTVTLPGGANPVIVGGIADPADANCVKYINLAGAQVRIPCDNTMFSFVPIANANAGFQFTSGSTASPVVDIAAYGTPTNLNIQVRAQAGGFVCLGPCPIGTQSTGSLALGTLMIDGSNSGHISIKGQADAGTYNFNLPIDAGTDGFALVSGGGGSAPMRYVALGGTGTLQNLTQTYAGGILNLTNNGTMFSTTGTWAWTVAGTSGGVPCFTSASSWASSGIMAANAPMIGGGAGVCPTSGTRTGNTTEFPTWTGTKTAGKQLTLDASNNIVISAFDVGSAAAAGDVTAAVAFAVTNRIIKSDGTGKGVKVSGIEIDVNDNMTLPPGAGFSLGGGSNPCTGSAACMNFGQGTAPAGLGTNSVMIHAPTAVTTSYRMILPDAPPPGNRLIQVSAAGVMSFVAAAAPAAPGLEDPGAGGMLARTALNTTTARTLAATTPVTMTNGDGQSGAPTVACPTCTITIASGAKALATSAIASAACSAAQTDTATGAATTDVVTASFNGDPTAVTGYIPLTAGMLTIVSYPTANTVNFKVCNNTSGSITPGAITLNWRVTR